MDEKQRALLFKAGAFLVGALLNYLYLLLIGNVGFNTFVFLFIFSALFMQSASEFVSHNKLFGLKLRRIEWFHGEVQSRETTYVAPETIYLPLCFCAVILWFQYYWAR